MSSTDDKVEELAARVEAMSPAQQLRLAAGLIERGQYEIAETLVDRVNTDLQVLRLFGKVKR